MFGQMMDVALSITSIMRFADQNHPQREIVSVTRDNPLHRTTYREAFERTRRLAAALADLGVQPGDRVATMAWNDHRHFEIYYATSCSGAVCHTINPRLFAEQIVYIVNHAQNRLLFIDVDFVSLLEGLAQRLPLVERFVVMTDQARMPTTSLKNAISYESLIAPYHADFVWPDLDEKTAAALCYTSGTTGKPKGVLYSHRSTVLHASSMCLPDVLGLAARDCVLPIVPMFHVCAWGVPYAAPMVGAKLVLPGPSLGDAQTLHALVNQEGVTCALGVPTVWLGLLGHLAESNAKLKNLQRIVVGGAACPPSVIDQFRKHGVYVHHAWGMTETSPLGTFNTLKPEMDSLPAERLRAVQAKQGRGIFGIEMRIADDANRDLPRDGVSPGRLQVRGPFVASGYYRPDTLEQSVESDPHACDGWFDTGDVATIDAEGFMQIVDRSKDLIKSGGEWISSIELENHMMAHPGVAMAAVIAVPHPKWGERPLLVIVAKATAATDKCDATGALPASAEPTKDDLLQWLAQRVAKWQLPDDVAFVDALPLTATGKVNKRELRRRLAQLPS